MLRFLTRFLAVVFAALFVVITVLTVFARPIATQMLAPQTYKRVLLEKQVAERFPEIVAETIGKAATATARKASGPEAERGEGDFGALLEDFSQADLQTLIGAALPADYVRAQCDAVIDQFFAYVHSDAARPTVKLSLVDLKQRLSGGVVEDAYIRVLKTKPPCASEPRGLPTACCPPEERLPELRERFREMIAPAVREMPDSVDILSEEANTYSVYTMMAKARSRVQLLAIIARWSWVAPVLLLLGVALFAVRSLRGLLLWWGIPCLLAGGFAAICALPGASTGDWFFRLVIAPSMPADVPVLAVQTIVGVLTAIVQVVLGAALQSAMWLTVAGLAAVVLAFFLGKRLPAAAT